MRQGFDNRVAYLVWNGPSASATGPCFDDAHDRARSAIISKGFAPVDGEETQAPQCSPPAHMAAWLVALSCLASFLHPATARAELPVVGQNIPFPNAPYAFRYEGPDFDPRATSAESAVRRRHEANRRGVPNPAQITPRITIVKHPGGEPIAHYEIPDGSFCNHEDDNCQMDGIFPIILASVSKEPVLAAVTHLAKGGQKLTIFQPQKDPARAIVEMEASKSLHLRPLPSGMAMELEHVLPNGKTSHEKRLWLTGDQAACTKAPAVALARPPELKGSARTFDTKLRRIARTRDLDALMNVMTEDVLVSFGGNGGKAELTAQWQLQTSNGQQRFWKEVDDLLSIGAGPQARANTSAQPEAITYPWYFPAWPSAHEAYDIYMVPAGTPLRAGPDPNAPRIATLPFTHARLAPPDGQSEAVDWMSADWLPVATPEHCLGYIRSQDAKPLLGTRLLARGESGTWKIEALVAGD